MSVPRSHHIRQNVCGNRPAYREGRQPKAVKVYTVAQESCYLLIQGVPAVGTHTDLNSLCSGYGDLKSFHALDDYPSEEFTEVYLVQFERIQSARYAKRKLDDMSYFGGVLHVCYAPEFESVEETREKLQDRRRQVAANIRKHEKERGSPKTVVEDLQSQLEQLEQNHPSVQDIEVGSEQEQKSGHDSQNSASSAAFEVSNQVPPLPRVPPLPKVPPITNYTLTQYESSSEFRQLDFSIPPPPQYGVHPHYARKHHQGYGYANVRSAHATLPLDYDGRLTDDLSAQNRKADVKTNSELKQNFSTSVTHNKTKYKPHKIVKGLVVKDYKSNHPVPKFVPRQAIKKVDQTEAVPKVKDSDEVNREIRKNAFTLGAPQGPEKPAELRSQTLDITQEAVVSVNSSVKEIRKQVAKFSSEPPVKKKKTK